MYNANSLQFKSSACESMCESWQVRVRAQGEAKEFSIVSLHETLTTYCRLGNARHILHVQLELAASQEETSSCVSRGKTVCANKRGKRIFSISFSSLEYNETYDLHMLGENARHIYRYCTYKASSPLLDSRRKWEEVNHANGKMCVHSHE